MTLEKVRLEEAHFRGPIWTERGDMLLGVLAGGVALSIAWWWIGVFYLNQPYNEILSYAAIDTVGYDVAGYQPLLILGSHTFSDFQVPLSWAHAVVHNQESPYLGLNPYAPLVPLLLAPLALLPVTAAFWLYTAVLLGAAVLPIWLLLGDRSWSAKAIILLLTTLVTTPMIATLDRGNLQLAVFACLGWAAWASAQKPKGRWRLASALLAIAIAIKAYPALLLVGPLALRRGRFVLCTAIAALVITSIALLLLPAGPLENAKLYLGWIVGNGNSGSWPSSTSLQALIRQGTNLVTNAGTGDSLFGTSVLWGLAPGFVWLFVIATIITYNRVPQWCWGPLLLATLQMTVPLSYAYTSTWAVLGAVWFARGDLINLPPSARADVVLSGTWLRLLSIGTIAMLTATLTPFVFRFITPSGAVISLMPLLSPLLIAVTGLLALAASLWPRAAAQPVKSATP